MKKLLCLLLALASLFTLFSCGSSEDESIEESGKAVTMYEKLAAYYTGRTLTDYKEAAALCAANFDMNACDWSGLIAAPSSGLKSFSEFLISVYFLKEADCDVSGCDTERYLNYLVGYLDDMNTISTVELSKLTIALVLYGRDFDMEGVAENLLSRQQTVGGGFYDYPQTGSEEATLNIEAAAFALMAYQTIRYEVGKPKYNDTINDTTMEYLFYEINDDNTVNDYYGKPSSSATALCLTALISAGMVPDGNNAVCLLDAADTFALNNAGTFAGYGEYKSDQSASGDATAYVLLCAVTAACGNPLIEKKAGVDTEVSE